MANNRRVIPNSQPSNFRAHARNRRTDEEQQLTQSHNNLSDVRLTRSAVLKARRLREERQASETTANQTGATPSRQIYIRLAKVEATRRIRKILVNPMRSTTRGTDRHSDDDQSNDPEDHSETELNKAAAVKRSHSQTDDDEDTGIRSNSESEPMNLTGALLASPPAQRSRLDNEVSNSSEFAFIDDGMDIVDSLASMDDATADYEGSIGDTNLARMSSEAIATSDDAHTSILSHGASINNDGDNEYDDDDFFDQMSTDNGPDDFASSVVEDNPNHEPSQRRYLTSRQHATVLDPGSRPAQIMRLLSSIEDADDQEASRLLNHLCQILMIINADTLQYLPKPPLVRIVSRFVPPTKPSADCAFVDVGSDISISNAIQACRALTFVCEASPSSAEAVSVVIPNLLNCLSDFAVVDIPEAALLVLECLAARNQGRKILLANGLEAIFRIVDFMSSSSMESVLKILYRCAAAARATQEEFDLMGPFIEFVPQGLKLEEEKNLLLVCMGIHQLTNNFRFSFKTLNLFPTQHPSFIKSLKDALQPSLYPNLRASRFLIVQSVSAICSGSVLIAKSILSIDNIHMTLLALLDEASLMAYGKLVARSKRLDRVYDVLTLIHTICAQASWTDNLLSELDREFLFPHKIVWQHNDRWSGWRNYTTTQSSIIEHSFLCNEERVSLIAAMRIFTIYLADKIQRNEETGRIRRIRRWKFTNDSSSMCEDRTQQPECNSLLNIIATLFEPIFKLAQDGKIYSDELSRKCWLILAYMVTYGFGLESSTIIDNKVVQLTTQVSLISSLMACALKISIALLRADKSLATDLEVHKALTSNGILDAALALCSIQAPPNSSQDSSNEHIASSEIPRRSMMSHLRRVVADNPLITIIRFPESRLPRVPRNMHSLGMLVERARGSDLSFAGSMHPASEREPQTATDQAQELNYVDETGEATETYSERRMLYPFVRQYAEQISKFQTVPKTSALSYLKALLTPNTTVFELTKNGLLQKLFRSTCVKMGIETESSSMSKLIRLLTSEQLITFVQKLSEAVGNLQRLTTDKDLTESEIYGSPDSSNDRLIAVSFVEVKKMVDRAGLRDPLGPFYCQPRVTTAGDLKRAVLFYHQNGYNGEQHIATCLHSIRDQQLLSVQLFIGTSLLSDGTTLEDIIKVGGASAFTRVQYSGHDQPYIPENVPGVVIKYEVTTSEVRGTWLDSRLQAQSFLTYGDLLLNPECKFPIAMLRQLALCHKYRHVLAEDVARKLDTIPEDAFRVHKLSAMLLDLFTDPGRLAMDSPIPRPARALIYHYHPLLPFETRRYGFYLCYLPRPSVLNYMTEEGYVHFAHGTDQFGRISRKTIAVKRDVSLKAIEDLLGRMRGQNMLDVTFIGEAGYGNGPTNEFYALISRKCRELDVWHQTTGIPIGLNSCTLRSLSSEQTYRLFGLMPYPVGTKDSSGLLMKLQTRFRFIGKFIAKALIDFKLVNAALPSHVYKMLLQLDLPLNIVVYKWLLGQERSLALSDMRYVDPDIHRHLWNLQDQLNQITGETNEQIRKTKRQALAKELEAFCLDFTLPGFPKFEIVSNGRTKNVTISNLQRYINRVVDFRLNCGIQQQMQAMRDGFDTFIPIAAIQCFYPEEMHMLVCGSRDYEWTIDYLREHCKYVLGYTSQSDQVHWLFQFMCDMSDNQRREFLQFVSGTPCLPVGGIRALSPPLTIARVVSADPLNSDGYLPTVMTCKNYIKLPTYSSSEVLCAKFNLAIKEGSNSFLMS